MASQQVFDTYELLEAVLLQLDLINILKAQAVAKQWKNTIESSIELRRACFLTPIAGIKLEPNLQSQPPQDPSSLRPLSMLPELKHQAFDCNPLFPLGSSRRPLGSSRTSPDVNFDLTPRVNRAKGQTSDAHLFCHIRLWRELANSSQVWRSMLITQPPCTAGSVWIVGQGWLHTALTIRNSSGITFGMVAEAADIIQRQCSITTLPSDFSAAYGNTLSFGFKTHGEEDAEATR